MRAIDLFCGAGGSGLALRQAGYQVLGIDVDADAIAVYRAAAGDGIVADVRDLDPNAFSADLLWASPPCPPWSEARRAQGRLFGFDHPDGSLLLEPLRWAQAVRPRWLVIENVDGLPDWACAEVVRRLDTAFPAVSTLRLDASGWVAQRRGHVFFVAGPRHVPVPAPLPSPPRFRDIADGHGARPVGIRELRYALSKRAFRVPVVGPDDCLPTVTVRPFSDRWTCFVMDEPGRIRFPTFIEAARAQGFPDDHPIHDLHRRNPGAAWRVLGNAVPVPLARAVLQSIVACERDAWPSLV